MIEQMSNGIVASRSIANEFGSRGSSLTPTPDAIIFELRGSSVSGQYLAGSGALVFEGEQMASDRVH